jgi:magnesium-transporting ATPase (P-type)
MNRPGRGHGPVPVTRTAGPADPGVPLLQAEDMVFSGTACTAGEARALVAHTGMRTELGRIAVLPRRCSRGPARSGADSGMYRSAAWTARRSAGP